MVFHHIRLIYAHIIPSVGLNVRSVLDGETAKSKIRIESGNAFIMRLHIILLMHAHTLSFSLDQVRFRRGEATKIYMSLCNLDTKEHGSKFFTSFLPAEHNILQFNFKRLPSEYEISDMFHTFHVTESIRGEGEERILT